MADIIGQTEFDRTNSGRVRHDNGSWQIRIPSVWIPAAGFITAPTNFWMTDDSMIRELIEHCNTIGHSIVGKEVVWLELSAVPPPAEGRLTDALLEDVT